MRPERSPAITVVLPLNVGHARAILEGITDYLRTQRDRWVNIVDLSELASVFSTERPSAMIAFLFDKTDERRISELGIPAVSVANTLRDPLLPAVYFDDVAAGRLAAEHLLECRLNHFAFLGDVQFPCIQKRLEGFQQALQARGKDCRLLDWSQEMETWRCFDPTKLIQQLRHLPKPVGLFAPYDVLAYHVARACHHARLQVPEEVAIIGVDNDPLICTTSQPPLTSIRIPAYEIGRRAAELVDHLLNGGAPPAGPIILPPRPPALRMSTELVSVADEKLSAALRYIRDHAHEPINVASLWASLKLDRKDLEYRFRTQLGRSPGQELTRVRVERAKQLLLDTELNIQKLSQACGFSSASYMISVFRKHVGVTPQLYRTRV